MPIQRDLYSPDSDYQQYTRNSMLTENQPKVKPNIQQHNIASSEIENINEIRKLIREQTLLNTKSNVKLRTHNSNSDSSDELEVPIRRFTPLPDIPRLDEPYFRTESRLIKNEIKIDKKEALFTKQKSSDSIVLTKTKFNYETTNQQTIKNNELKLLNCSKIYFENFNTQSLNETQFNKYNVNKTRYHFASTASTTTTNHKKLNHRLPALEKIITHSIQNTMDLDEDLPMNPVNEPVPNQRQIYTSPGNFLQVSNILS